MTQHRWQTEDGWDVLTGWDRPLQHWFLTISRDCVACDGGGCGVCYGTGEVYAYDNLNDATNVGPGRGMSRAKVEDKLEALLTDYDRMVLDTMFIEAVLNVGNKVTNWPTRGRLRAGTGANAGAGTFNEFQR